MVREGQISYLRLPSKLRDIFCAAYNYSGKADVGRSYWNSRRKLGVATHFSLIIKLNFGGKCHTLFGISMPFRIIVV